MRYLITIVLLALMCLVYAYFHLGLGPHPSIEETAIFLTIGVLLALIPVLKRERSSRGWMIAVALAAAFAGGVMSIRTLDAATPIGKFKRLYSAIRDGMTPAEVEAIVAQEFRGVRPSMRWNAGRGFIGLGPVDPDYDAECIGITTADGKVIGKAYFPD